MAIYHSDGPFLRLDEGRFRLFRRFPLSNLQEPPQDPGSDKRERTWNESGSISCPSHRGTQGKKVRKQKNTKSPRAENACRGPFECQEALLVPATVRDRVVRVPRAVRGERALGTAGAFSSASDVSDFSSLAEGAAFAVFSGALALLTASTGSAASDFAVFVPRGAFAFGAAARAEERFAVRAVGRFGVST